MNTYDTPAASAVELPWALGLLSSEALTAIPPPTPMILELVSLAETVTLPAISGSATVPVFLIEASVSVVIELIAMPAAIARLNDAESLESGGMFRLADVFATAAAMAAATDVICELLVALTVTAPETATSVPSSSASAPPPMRLEATPAPIPALPPKAIAPATATIDVVSAAMMLRLDPVTVPPRSLASVSVSIVLIATDPATPYPCGAPPSPAATAQIRPVASAATRTAPTLESDEPSMKACVVLSRMLTDTAPAMPTALLVFCDTAAAPDTATL